MTKPIHAAVDAANRTAQARRRHRVAETHGEERRDHIGHRRPVQRHRSVIGIRVVERRRQRAAHQHLPCAQHDRGQEHGKGDPIVIERQAATILHSSSFQAAASCGNCSSRDDLDARPHAVMAVTTEFMAWHIVDAGSAETGADFGDETRHHHRVHVGRGKQEAVNHVGAGKAKFHRRIDGNPHAIRNEGVLLARSSGP